jgi:hypothetical protein
MKIRPAGAELFHTDRRTDMTKVTVAFCNFANAPKKETRHINKLCGQNAVVLSFSKLKQSACVASSWL